MPVRITDQLLNLVLSPALWLSVFLGLTVALLCYAWRGGGWRHLLADVAAGLAGFALGQAAALLLRLDWGQVGQVYVLAGMVGSLIALMARRLLWRRAQPL
ncbi:MAG: hypothetical protein FJ011_22260 [Chloroflexi bacterium]|nr:hypothetical protein [Chloroflexota bacterium]